MVGFGGVNEVGGRTGGGQRGGDLARDMPRLADAADDHAATRGKNQLDRRNETRVDAIDQCADCLGFDAQHATAEFQGGSTVRCRWLGLAHLRELVIIL